MTRDHYVEVDLGEDAPQSGPLYLIAHGSIYPTDSSINVAMTQGERWRARGLSLEVPDGRGGWIVARDNLGFPAGRKKTILVDLDERLPSRRPRAGCACGPTSKSTGITIEWARGLPDTALKTVRLDPAVADLHYRGYSVIDRPDAGAPEVPDYDRISGTKQRWRDLIGYYTRFGDVRELLEQVDDRYVIMNSGDEMSLRFAEQPPPPAGWAARLRHRRRRLDQGRRLQLDVLQDRAAVALSRQARVHHAARPARGRVGLPATSRGLADVSHALCHARRFQERVDGIEAGK